MQLADLLPTGPSLRLEALVRHEAHVQLVLTSGTKCAPCPDCQRRSKGIHSFYKRDLGDLPWAGIPMRLKISVRKFFCRNASCPRKIFTERLGEQMGPYARRTKRSTEHLTALGLISGGNAGAMLAAVIGLPVSASTMLRILHRLPDRVEFEAPRVVGIDDWAFRKGRTYGTIVVDLEKGKPIDLLPDREIQTVAQWLQAYLSIEIISRDRADAYAAAAKAGAPTAIEVADRWHLLKNLSEALKRLLDKHNKELRAAAVELAKAKSAEVVQPTDEQEDQAPAQQIAPDSAEKPLSKYELNFQEVKRLQAESYSIHAIARQTGLHRETIKKYFRYEEYPQRAITFTKSSSALSFEAHLRKRWDEGERNRKKLWREITEQGYSGSFQSVYRLTDKFPAAGDKEVPTPPLEVRIWSATKVSLLLVKEQEALTEEERTFLQTLYQTYPLAERAGQLSRQFKTMSDTLKGEQLDEWIEQALTSGIEALKNFARGLQQDYDAVKSALTLKWSNGPVEGQINRLKTIKRQMYGRAGFLLLKKRVLADTG